MTCGAAVVVDLDLYYMSGPNDTPAARAIDAHDDMTSVIKNFTVANIRLEIRTIYHSA